MVSLLFRMLFSPIPNRPAGSALLSPPSKVVLSPVSICPHRSTVGFQAIPMMTHVVDALSRSPDSVTFLPPQFATKFSQEDVDKFPAVAAPVDMFNNLVKKAEEKGVGLTGVWAGVFHDFFFGYKWALLRRNG